MKKTNFYGLGKQVLLAGLAALVIALSGGANAKELQNISSKKVIKANYCLTQIENNSAVNECQQVMRSYNLGPGADIQIKKLDDLFSKLGYNSKDMIEVYDKIASVSEDKKTLHAKAINLMYNLANSKLSKPESKSKTKLSSKSNLETTCNGSDIYSSNRISKKLCFQKVSCSGKKIKADLFIKNGYLHVTGFSLPYLVASDAMADAKLDAEFGISELTGSNLVSHVLVERQELCKIKSQTGDTLYVVHAQGKVDLSKLNSSQVGAIKSNLNKYE
ncbi:hypothetical protein HN587_02230 [Candidatus Woesearchaeota archaeon]|jgi:hypothetical protein|nr:hypothetical protein [Candidatus Woesearchaeota archaeon]